MCNGHYIVEMGELNIFTAPFSYRIIRSIHSQYGTIFAIKHSPQKYFSPPLSSVFENRP
ncbi:protein of unknown function [Pararobbsia alpina]